ncbi:hypothetical protein G6F61_015230 [Rhizopus arrhizus]|nr:hypothetical protein G6F68_020437 [Rhizopus microsporus]KAG1320559.1 hypothetical protein G6F61_015230 [Rhizopus arrhizus]
MPVVLASPPAPGLSWVSAMTTGRDAPAVKACARRTASAGSRKSGDHCGSSSITRWYSASVTCSTAAASVP